MNSEKTIWGECPFALYPPNSVPAEIITNNKDGDIDIKKMPSTPNSMVSFSSLLLKENDVVRKVSLAAVQMVDVLNKPPMEEILMENELQ